MALILITYDLKKEKNSENYSNIINVIKSEGKWARLSESSYVMDTELTAYEIFTKMKPYIDDNDTLLAIPLTSPYFGQHSKEVIDWLSKRLSS